MQVITVDKDNGKRVFSRKEVATICDVSTQTISLWEKAGDIPVSVRDDNSYRYWYEEEVKEIKKYADSNKYKRKK